MSRKLWLGILHLFCAGLIGLPVFGATQTWSDQVTLTEDVTDDVELDGEVAVTVASDSTVMVSGAISDKAGTKGKIKLLGGGTLVLATANTFSGGAYVDTGVLQVTCAGALGDGAITVKGGTSAKSQLQFNFSAIKSQGTITYANPITVENGGSTKYYQLQFGPHYNVSSPDAEKKKRQTLNLTGDITCAGDLYMTLNNSWATASEPNLYLNNVSVDGMFYLDRPSIDIYIQGAFVAGDFACGNYGKYPARLYSSENRLDRISFSNGGIECLGANVLGGAAMAYVRNVKMDVPVDLKMNSFDQMAAYLSTSGYDTSYLPQVTATAPVTLTLTGGVAQATFEGSVGENVSLTVDADEGTSFEQILTGNLAAMDGLITVNRGKLTLSNAATIPTDGLLAFNLGEHGMIDLGGRSYTAKSVTINGVEQRNTTLTHTTHPNNIAEGTTITAGGGGDQTIETDMTVTGDWEAFVADGITWTVTAQQTGSGKIIKRGTGTLVLKAANSFTGGLQLDAGTVIVAKNGALGDGDVTIAGSTANDCQLRFDTVQIGEASTVVNKITLTGDSDATHQAIFFDFPTTAQDDIWTVTFTGGITAAGDLYFGDNHGGKTSKETGVDWSAKNWVTFDCAINAAGKTVGIAPVGYTPGCTVNFNGKVTAGTFSFRGYTGSKTGGAGSVRFNAANEIGTLSCAYNHVYATVDNALGDAKLDIIDKYDSARTGFYLGNGTTQWMKSLKTVTSSGSDMNILPSSGTATLVIDGGSADSATAQVSLQGGLSLVVDAQDDAFTQTLTNRSHSMTGSITVKRGKLVICRTTEFNGLSALAVSNGAVFRAEAAIAGIVSNKLDLVIETGAVLDVASDTFTVKTLTVDGKSYRNGTYTKNQIPALPEGVTLTVTAGSTITAAEWTGAAGADDTSTATLQNWTVGGKVPTADDLPLDDGSLVATITGGTGMTYGDGDFLNCLTNDIAITDGMVPFVIAPASATPDACLRIRNGFVSDKKAQVVLSGRIAAPVDATGDTTLRYTAATADPLPSGTIRPENVVGKSIPLVLDGVTLDLPLSVGVGDNANTLMARANTTNDLNGPVETINYSAYFSADAGAVIRFNGGFKASNAYHFMGPGEYQVNASPVQLNNGAIIEKSGKVVLDAEDVTVTGNNSREGFVLSSGALEFRRNNCFVEATQIALGGAKDKFAVEFNQTTQRIGRANFAAAASNVEATLNGAYPAMLEVTGATRTGANADQLKDPYCSAQVTGGLGFHMMWADETLTLANRAFASCGNLEASAGTLELADGATWLNGTNFVARGTGALRFGGNRQVGNDAVLRIEDSGKVEIADGKRLKVAECWVGDTKIPDGAYTYANAPEPLKEHLVETDGRLSVGRVGMMIFVR